MALVECELARILIQETSSEQYIVLREKEGGRSFPIVIGLFEALAIDRKVREIPTARPMTHDLLSNLVRDLGGTLDRICINDLQSNTFYAKLYVRQDGRLVEMDSRPSDAVALAVSFRCPIFVSDEVIGRVSGGAAASAIEELEKSLGAPEEDAEEAASEDDETEEPDEGSGEER